MEKPPYTEVFLHGVETWVFDLDNTLYPSTARLFDQINIQMTCFISETLKVSSEHANALRRDLWERHGTTMTGLATEYGIDPDTFLRECHRLDLSGLEHDPGLARKISGLSGRSIVHTNGPRAHADRVLAARGLEECFDHVIAIEDTRYRSKPAPEAFALAHSLAALNPRSSVMIEDHVENLREPKRLGMRTVWLAPADQGEAPDYVDLKIRDLASFLDVLGPEER